MGVGFREKFFFNAKKCSSLAQTPTKSFLLFGLRTRSFLPFGLRITLTILVSPSIYFLLNTHQFRHQENYLFYQFHNYFCHL